ncbi:MAG: type II toxin-antitoxin system HicB family antitoxin [Opitutaceae bacterium]|jgi:predicted RNase H-like HicB family nuclease|nr:type II toxin-antitoxin system HicB family antitoxin [Opitutaceae bacterium]
MMPKNDADAPLEVNRVKNRPRRPRRHRHIAGCACDGEMPRSPLFIMKTLNLTAVLEKEGTGYVSLCPELDAASQGDSVEEALANLREAAELFLATADPAEVAGRAKGEVFATRFEAAATFSPTPPEDFSHEL